MSARELLLFAHDHSSTGPHPIKHLAALPKPFDLITHLAEGAHWGDCLTHPWHRIVVWPDASVDELDAMLSPLRESGGDPGNPAALGQYRAFSLTFNEPGFATWWADHTRAAPKFILKTPDIVKAKRPRAHISNPSFVGVNEKVIG